MGAVLLSFRHVGVASRHAQRQPFAGLRRARSSGTSTSLKMLSVATSISTMFSDREEEDQDQPDAVGSQHGHFGVGQIIEKRAKEERAVDARRVDRGRLIAKEHADEGSAPLTKYLSPRDTRANIPNPIANGMPTAAETNPPTMSLRTFEIQGCGISHVKGLSHR
jgi:hypothetical protein